MSKEIIFAKDDSSATRDKLKQFDCRRCNQCCLKPGYVYITPHEAEKIADHLSMDVYEFTDMCCEVVSRQKLVLKKRLDESCIFLEKEGCFIHEAKPQQCVDFPSKWRTRNSYEYCEGLKELFPTAPADKDKA